MKRYESNDREPISLSSQRGRRGIVPLHPAVPAVYLTGVLVISMLCMQPVVVALSLMGALACSVVARGLRATVQGVVWQLPLVVLIALLNPLFSASGSTLLVRLGPVAVYLESLAYGACAGALLVSTVVWLECLAACVAQDGLFTLGASAFPTATLAVSMCARLVPQLMRRAQAIADTERACTAAKPTGGSVSQALTTSTALMTWAMEDSLVRADSMRARGWGAKVRRSSFRPRRFGVRDASSLACSMLILLAGGFLAWVAASQWVFYPVMPVLVPWWGYVLVAALFALPACALAALRAFWR